MVRLRNRWKRADCAVVFAAGDGVDHLRLLLALHHDEIEFENRELVLDASAVLERQ